MTMFSLRVSYRDGVMKNDLKPCPTAEEIQVISAVLDKIC
jgi:hypothetical protein